MSIFKQAVEEAARETTRTEKDAETTIGGASVDIGEPTSSQGGDDGTWLTGSNKYGRPRGREAREAAQIQQTWPMEIITNGIVDQLLGGTIGFQSDDDDDVDQAEADLQALVGDVLRGPHLRGQDFDDLISAAVADMVGPGNAYWEVLPAADGSLPVAALEPVDALTVRHNVDEHGVPDDPPYYQAPFADGTSLASASPAKLEGHQLVELRYPGSNRSGRIYPRSPAQQVRGALEALVNSTTHHNRYYADDQIPAGFIQIMGANDTSLSNIEDKLQAAAGDPRSVEVIGGEGAAQWIEMGGTAINLDVIEEQKWFLQLCLAAFGLSKQEINLIDDVNRSTSDGQLQITHKRITTPFARTIGQAISRQVLPQFDLYRELGQPFDVVLQHSDPAQERAREAHLMELYDAGAITYRELRQRMGDEVADDELTVTIDGQDVAWGDLPKDVREHVLRDARSDPDADADADAAE